MPSMLEIVEGMAAAIAEIEGIQSKGFILDNPTPPYAQVIPGGDAGEISYDEAMGGGLTECPFTVQVFSGSPSTRGAQIRLLEYINPSGDRSIKTALETHDATDGTNRNTLGGIIDDLQVKKCTGYRRFAPDDATKPPLLCATFYVTVFASIE